MPARTTRAQPAATVVLVHAPAAPPTVTEALVHLRGELAAAGFGTQIMEVDVGPDVRASLEHAAPGVDAVALVAVLAVPAGAAESSAAEVWVIDRVTRKTVVRRARTEAAGARAAQILSVRAVELLRASFVELAITSSSQSPAETATAVPTDERPATAATAAAAEPPPAGVAAAQRWADEAVAEPRRAWSYGIELGGVVLGSLGGVGSGTGGVGPTLLPTLRLERAVGERVLVRVSGAGLGAPARVTAPAGYVEVTQNLLLAEAVVRLRPLQVVQPLVSAGAGALRVRADGHPPAPYEAMSGARWAAALDAGAGVRFSLRRRIDLAFELHALLAEPYPTVRFVTSDVATVGRPSLLGSVTLVGGL